MIIIDEIKNRVTNLYTNIITLKMEIENKNKELELLRNQLKNGNSVITEEIEQQSTTSISEQAETGTLQQETIILQPEIQTIVPQPEKSDILVDTLNEDQTNIVIPIPEQTQIDFNVQIEELTHKLEMKETDLVNTKKELKELKQELKKTKQELEKTVTEFENEISKNKNEKPESEIVIPEIQPVLTITEDQKKEFEKMKDELFGEHTKNTKLRSECIVLIEENKNLKLALKEKGKKGLHKKE